MLSKVNASQNLRQTISNAHNGFQSLASIKDERLDNILKDQYNYHLREKSKKECQEEKAQIKQTISDQSSKRQSK